MQHRRQCQFDKKNMIGRQTGRQTNGQLVFQATECHARHKHTYTAETYLSLASPRKWHLARQGALLYLKYSQT